MTDVRMEDGAPTPAEFEGLFVNNPGLDRLRAGLSRFNPIRTMGMEQMEIRHSAILGWLLDPQETHGLGDEFLRAFLAEALRGFTAAGPPSALTVSQSDMRDAEVRREWRHIDLLVLSPSNGWAFVIENKVHSRQHGDQLRRYLEIAEAAFGRGARKLTARGVFLTLHGEDPEDARYAPIQYAAICELLPRLLRVRAHPLSPEVGTFLDHWLDVIRKAAGMSDDHDELVKLAKRLYRDHRKVPDFVVKHGASTEFAVAAESVFGEDIEKLAEVTTEDGDRWIFGSGGSDRVSFLPKAWFDALGGKGGLWKGCDGWWMGYPLIVWLQLLKGGEGPRGRSALLAEVGPLADHGLRSDLIETIGRLAGERGSKRIRFGQGAMTEGRRFSRFLRGNTLPVEDVQDHELVAQTMRKALRDFRPEFEVVASVLPQFGEHGRPDREA